LHCPPAVTANNAGDKIRYSISHTLYHLTILIPAVCFFCKPPSSALAEPVIKFAILYLKLFFIFAPSKTIKLTFVQPESNPFTVFHCFFTQIVLKN
jgi:hypothetical protein